MSRILLLRPSVVGVLSAALSLGCSAVTRAQDPASGGLAVERLRTEYAENPFGIDVERPRLSWWIRADDRNVRQAAYRIRVARTASDVRAGRRLVWDSGRVTSDASVHRVYDGAPLVSRQRYSWQVQVWDTRGRTSGWSVPAWWEMGLLDPADWNARWIEPGLREDETTSPMLRRAFRLDKGVTSARAYVTSHGLYELHINGQRIGEDVLTPGWTSYNKRLQYQVYDVTRSLQRGVNAIGIVLGNGWYRGHIGFTEQRNLYGARLGLLLQLEVTHADGSRVSVTSDGSWRASSGPILMSEIYHGETYDARLEKPGWATAGFDDGGWTPVRVVEHPLSSLVASAGPPVRRMGEIVPAQVLETPDGRTVVDMGQNMVGWVRLRVEGPAGTTVTLRHAEVLDQAGNAYFDNLRRARQTVTYTLKGGGVEIYEPHFTFQGFRYVQVQGYPGQLTPSSLTGIVVHSAMPATGEFSTSDPLLNRLQRNIQWGQKGNFVDVPTDCPQRDERLGWTGDAQAFAGTAAFNMDVAPFFTKWLADMAADQLPDGSVPHVIPDVITRPGRPAAGSAGWADAVIIVPWTLYLTYGDTRVLEEMYPAMVRWVEYMRRRAGDDGIWTGDFHFGDWLAFATRRADYPGATTGTDLIATAFYAHSTDLLARIARVLEKDEDAETYERLFARIKAAWRHEFVTPGGRVGEDTQTAYVLALQFDLLSDGAREKAAMRLHREVTRRTHLTTGFLGTPYLLHVLSRFRLDDAAYALLERKEYPSWLYPLTKGATTIWERWDGIAPDGSFQDPGMNSFNHYAYGAVGEWMYSTLAGLHVDERAPGYKHVRIEPRPGGSITSASARYQSMHGPVSSSWSVEGDRFQLSVEVPPNATATVRLPEARLASTMEGGRPVLDAEGVLAAREEGASVVVEIGSGRYAFACAWRGGIVFSPGRPVGSRVAPARTDPPAISAARRRSRSLKRSDATEPPAARPEGDAAPPETLRPFGVCRVARGDRDTYSDLPHASTSSRTRCRPSFVMPIRSAAPRERSMMTPSR